MTIKLRKHGYKNWKEAIERDCAPGHAPHDPRVIYNRDKGFRVKSRHSGLNEGDYVVLENYEPYGTTESEYKNAVANMERKYL